MLTSVKSRVRISKIMFKSSGCETAVIVLWFAVEKAVVALGWRVIFLCDRIRFGTMIYPCLQSKGQIVFAMPASRGNSNLMYVFSPGSGSGTAICK